MRLIGEVMTKEHQTLLDDADSKVQLACAALDEYRNRSEASVLTPYRQLKREHYLFGQIATAYRWRDTVRKQIQEA